MYIQYMLTYAGYRAIRLKASSEAEMMTWINNIEEAIGQLRTQCDHA